MEGPAQTLNYMIAGYAVIFSLMAAYAASLWIRWRKLKREQQELQDLLPKDD
jgi:hypothetical protein